MPYSLYLTPVRRLAPANEPNSEYRARRWAFDPRPFKPWCSARMAVRIRRPQCSALGRQHKMMMMADLGPLLDGAAQANTAAGREAAPGGLQFHRGRRSIRCRAPAHLVEDQQGRWLECHATTAVNAWSYRRVLYNGHMR